ncbi:MAG TPA: short-chain dehydrogenase/reductase [Dehalococcoidia bacterium]|nr:short-chain dehydrogenase/reductase [Dehalococcoidia bacterium]
MDLELRGRRAVVTGASKGIGLAIAQTLAAEGVALAICSRTDADIQGAATELGRRYEVPVAALAVDLSDAAGVERFATFAMQELGGVDILVNNAGAIPRGTIDSLDDETWQEAYALKFWGFIRMARALLPQMRSRRDGVILNIIGNAGKEPHRDYIAGGPANAGLMNFTKTLALDCAADGIRVVAVNPGAIRTPRMNSRYERMAREQGVTFQDIERESAKGIPLGRVGEAEEVAYVAAFLVSPRASYITGSVIPVEGGATGSV